MKQKITSLQSLRSIAFLMVFLSHCDEDRIGMGGAIGVSIFFVLSGFLMTYSYDDRELKTSCKDNVVFALNKASKLYFLNFIVTSGAFILTLRALIKADKVEYIILQIVKYVLDLLMVQSWIPDKQYYFSNNSGSWYLSTCFFLYFVFPWIWKGLKKVKQCHTVMILGVSAYVFQFAIAFVVSKWEMGYRIGDNFVKWVTYISPLYRLICFFIGCCVGKVYLLSDKENSKPLKSKKYYTIMEAVALFLVFGSLYITQRVVLYNSSLFWIRYTVIYTPGSVAAVYLFARNLGTITRILNNTMAVRLGDISPYMYLFHQRVLTNYSKFVQRYWNKGIDNIRKSTWLKTILAFGVTLLLSEAYIIIQKKYNQSINGKCDE